MYLTVLDKMTVEEIHCKLCSHRTYEEISKYFLKSQRFNDEQRYLHPFIEAKQCGNPCAAEVLVTLAMKKLNMLCAGNFDQDAVEKGTRLVLM